MNSSSRTGEIALTLTIISLGIMLMGAALGGLQKSQTLLGKAAGTCSYKALAMVTINGRQPFSSQDNGGTGLWGISNNKASTLEFDPSTSKSEREYRTENLTFKPQNPGADYYKGELADVFLIGLNRSKWKVKRVFCDNHQSNQAIGCQPNTGLAISPNGSISITNIKVDCDVDIVYGFEVESTTQTLPGEPTPTSRPPTITPTPTRQPPTSFPSPTKALSSTPTPSKIPRPTGGTSPTGVPTRQPSITIQPTPTTYLSETPTRSPSGTVTTQPTPTIDPTQLGTIAVSVNDNRKQWSPVNWFKIQICDDYDPNHGIPCTQGRTVMVSFQDFHIVNNLPLGKKHVVLDNAIYDHLGRQISSFPLINIIHESCGDNGQPSKDYPNDCIVNVESLPGASALFSINDICPVGQVPLQDGQCVTVDQSSCKHVKGNGTHRILFVTEGSLLDLDTVIAVAIKRLEDTDLGSLLQKLSYYKLDIPGLDLKCSTSPAGDAGGGDMVTCGGLRSSIDSLKQLCNADTIIINSNQYGRSTGPKGQVSLSSNDAGVIHHELGHAIAELDDEYFMYDGGSEIPSRKINCTQDANCTDWKTKYGNTIGCYKSCKYGDWSRSSINSIMNANYNPGGLYEAVNLDGWKDKLGGNSQQFALDTTSISSQEKSIYHNTISLDLLQQKYGKVNVSKVNRLESYPQKLQSKGSIQGYTVKILDQSSKTIYQTFHDAYVFNSHAPKQDQIKLSPSLELYLPYFTNAKSIVISDETNTTVLSISLDQFNVSKPVSPRNQNMCGNSMCDVETGEDNLSCRADCQPEQTTTEKDIQLYHSDIDNNKTVNGLDYARMIKQYGFTYETGKVPADVNRDGNINALDSSIMLGNFGKKVN